MVFYAFVGIIASGLSTLRQLKKVKLRDCLITKPFLWVLLAGLSRCPLEELDLSGNYPDGVFPKIYDTRQNWGLLRLNAPEKIPESLRGVPKEELLKFPRLGLSRCDPAGHHWELVGVGMLMKDGHFPELKQVSTIAFRLIMSVL